jgi:hypothetical protein
VTARKAEKSFIGFDGEGISDSEGVPQRYVMFGNSLGDWVEGHDLGHETLFEFLLDCKRDNPHSFFVMFGMNYDVNMFVKDLPRWLVEKLWKNQKCSYRGYTISYLPSKMFRLSSERGSIVVYDLFSFFQQSFVEALKGFNITSDEDMEKIVAGKANRGTFANEDIEMMKDYFFTECRELAKLADALRESLKKADVHITKWHGPGAIANYALTKLKMARYRSPVHPVAPYSYSGGRFEQFQLGFHIRSAYPEALALLPSLREGWGYEKHPTEIRPFGFYRIGPHHSDNVACPQPFVWRSAKGNIGYPAHIDNPSWQVGSVVASALRAGILVDVLEGYYPLGESRPFAEYINTTYRQRAIWKAEGNTAHIAAKLGMNSIYGKLAQQVGGTAEKLPRWHQLDWAAMVTGYARAKLFDAMSLSPETVIACETDSVFSTVPLDLPLGTNLGEWDLEEHDNILYYQNGIYFTDGANAKYKVRGLGKGMVDYDSMLAMLDTKELAPFEVTVRRFLSMGTHSQKDDWCAWVDQRKMVDPLNSDRKRVHIAKHCPACKEGKTFREGLHRMVPNPGYGYRPSEPYSVLWHTREDQLQLKEQYDG